MNIAVVAPLKFDYQDLVCIERLLTLHGHPKVRFFVEKKGGEDAEIELGDASRKTVEIQVKGSAAPVSLVELATWLAHFPDLKSHGCLLERLLSNEELYAHFVLTGRCNDDASAYLVGDKWSNTYKELEKLPRNAARDIFNALKNLQVGDEAGGSALEGLRQKHLGEVLSNAGVRGLAKALKRVLITDQATEDVVLERCERMLRSDHAIPNDELSSAIHVLRDVVKDAKNRSIDAFQRFCDALIKIRPEPIRPLSYVPREYEARWIDELTKYSTLLLSGAPRTGKTFAARWIAAELSVQGYAVRQTSSVEVAERFLLDGGIDQRLVVLDDPLGGSHAVTEPARLLDKIQSLISRLGVGRKLIIAQAQEHLFEVLRVDCLAKAALGVRQWVDCTASSGVFLAKIWGGLVETFTVPNGLAEVVRLALLEGKLVLEPGCLAHLAASHNVLAGQTDLRAVERLARQSASDLGRAWRDEGLARMVSSLVVCTEPGVSVSERDLAFVLGYGGSHLPGIITEKGFSITLGADRSSGVSDELGYQDPPQLAQADLDKLEKLELRRTISWLNALSLNFTHPFYRSAAEGLVDDATQPSQAKALTILAGC